MSGPEATVEQPAPEQRACIKCEQTKAVTAETWVYKKGRTGRYQAHGNICRACDIARRADYETRRDKIKAMVTAAPDNSKEAKAETKLDVAKALKAGSRVLNEFAPNVLARLLQYAEDPDHPQHQWALDKLVDRILPRKLYEELGGQAAGVGSLNDKRPVFNIQILPASPAPEGRVIPGHAEVETVELLPSPTIPEQQSE